jgi:WD40 repeat protein
MVLALSADGKWVADGEGGGTVCVWDRASREKVFFKQMGEGEEILAIAFSPDGSSMAAVSKKEQNPSEPLALTVWATRTWKEQRRLFWKHGWARHLAFHPHLQRLFAGGVGEGGNIRVWDLTTGKVLFTRKSAGTPVTAMALSPDGRLLVTGSETTVEVWDAESGVPLWSFKGFVPSEKEPGRHSEPEYLTTAAFLPDSRRFVTAGGPDRSVRLWDIGIRKEICVLRCQIDPPSMVAVSADGTMLVAAGLEDVHSWTARIEVWDLPGPRRRGSFEIRHTNGIEAKFSSEGRWLVTWTDAALGGLQVWDLSTLPARNEDE